MADSASPRGARAMAAPAVHLAGASAIAVAQPLFDILSRNPEFFAAHRTSPFELWLLTAGLVLILPLVCLAAAGVASLVGRRAARAVVAGGMGVFAAAFALQLVKRAGDPGAFIALGLAAAAGAAVAVLYTRVPGVRAFAALVGTGAVLFPAVFLLRPSLRPILRPHVVPVADVRPADPAPVVFVLFDQFPLASIVGSDGRIEASAYPSIAALAGDGTWYRNATSVNPVTGWAAPAVLSGLRPDPDELPVAADHPHTLFTLLGGAYDMHVVEPITDLCPASLCRPTREPALERTASVLSDLSIAYLHIVLPSQLTRRLPSVTENWKDFAEDSNWQQRWAEEHDRSRGTLWDRFVAGISRGERPALHFVHVLLPHDPFVYLPDGTRYTHQQSVPGLSDTYVWATDAWAVTQGYRRHLLQVAFVDRLVGRLVARLKAEHLYDEALIVLTADHGAGFRPGGPLRNVDTAEWAGILGVPLIIKRPFQHGGRTSDANVESIDILPTVADVLGIPLPWPVDGSPIGGPPRDYKEMSYERVSLTERFPPSMLDGLLALARRKEALFGRAPGPFRYPLGGPAPDMVGQPVAQLPLSQAIGSNLTVTIDRPERFADVDPASGYLPARISGGAVWPHSPLARLGLAVAVNGVVRATTWTLRPDPAGASWSAIVPKSAFKRGANHVAVFVLDEPGPTVRLVAQAGAV